MDDKIAWKREKVAPGVCQITLNTFEDFPSLITADFNDTRRYVWRGQQCSNWNLETSLTRRIRNKSTPVDRLSSLQLGRFKNAARGPRGTHSAKLKDNRVGP